MVAALLAASLVLATPAFAGSSSRSDTTKRAGLGIGSGLATLVYAPVKLTYAIGGCLVGGLAWAFSGGDNQVAKVVLVPSVLGDYVITPKQLTRDEPIEFFGRESGYTREDLEVASTPETEYQAAW